MRYDHEKKEFVLVGKKLIENLSDFTIVDKDLLITPIDKLIKGVHFESSQYNDSSFYVNVFAMPVCVPTSYMYFNFGHRIRHKGGGDRWNMGMTNLVGELGAALNVQALPFLSSLKSLLDFIEVVESFPVNQRSLEAIGFSLARAGQIEKSIAIFNRLLDEINLNIAWQRDLANQAAMFKQKLMSNYLEAHEQLVAWELETIYNLKLQKFWRCT